MQQTIQLTQVLQQASTLIVGESKSAERMRALAKRLGETDHTVLIQGETGTGKEVAAHEIHNNCRHDSPFVPVNCSAILETLFESELFGHKKGSFTGASEDREGFLKSAGDGTVFLDEVGTLPLTLQVKILRVLEDGIFSPVGDRRQIHMKARIIAGTNINLEKAVSEGKFRSDLFYRLNVIPFDIPPLRERLEDVPVLVEHFLGKENGGHKKFAPDVLPAMMSYQWPGNIRELKNIVVRSAFLANGDEEIKLEHVLPYLIGVTGGGETKDKKDIRSDFPVNFSGGKLPKLPQLHEDYIRAILTETRGNLSKGARITGMKYRTLTNWIRKFRLESFLVSLRNDERERKLNELLRIEKI